MPQVRIAHVGSPLGPLWLAETDAGVAAVSGSDELETFLAPLRRRFVHLELVPAEVDAGWLESATLPPVDLRGLPEFDRAVYEVVRGVPPGETVTYGEVAALAGSPGAARAVGGAMSRCPLFPAVPCHRVVRASDGWSGWGGDERVKRRLLASEREGR